MEGDREGIVEEKGKERRDAGERERGDKWRRRRGSDGWPEDEKAASGGENIVRAVVVVEGRGSVRALIWRVRDMDVNPELASVSTALTRG